MTPTAIPSDRGQRLLAVFLAILLISVVGCSNAASPEVGDADEVPTASTTTIGIVTTTDHPMTSTTTTVASTTAARTTAKRGPTTTASTTTSNRPRPHGPPAPDFGGVTLAGEETSLSSFAGKPLVLVFWSSG